MTSRDHEDPWLCPRPPLGSAELASWRTVRSWRSILEEPTVIDLFAGAGGLTAGLERAGWRTVAAVDKDAASAATLRATQEAQLTIPGDERRRYLAAMRVIEDDAARISRNDLVPAGAHKQWRPSLLAGGPPCQPFSSSGRQRGVEDPRGQLFLEFVRLATELNPRLIVFENVRGLLTAKDPQGRPGGVLKSIQDALEDIGYACRLALLNAADFGAPQRRVRLFILASRDIELPIFPAPTHSRDSGSETLHPMKPWVSLQEFLDSQPAPDEGDVVRPSGSRAEALQRLNPGQGLRSGGVVEANRPGGHWGYRQDSFLAAPDTPARTVRAATTPDWVRLADGSLRRLTWHECAGLQGFPADWRFQGTQAQKFRQIGNAVQGDVATSLGRALMTSLLYGQRTKPVSSPWPGEFIRRVRYTEMEHRVNAATRAAARQDDKGSGGQRPRSTASLVER